MITVNLDISSVLYLPTSVATKCLQTGTKKTLNICFNFQSGKYFIMKMTMLGLSEVPASLTIIYACLQTECLQLSQ